ncbi:hypothetical protein, partial [Sediminispirochaeta bajacaliforniensis]|uniref:hypothetical protein n=1 Tax=Sediminispirochaeta bajacaliforniensis TaxID=148 RepID=UPI0012B5C3B7
MHEAVAVFRENERLDGGFFPVGVNNCWHGGIHLRSREKAIHPLSNGTLAAYRIAESNCEIPLLKSLSKREYEHIQEMGKRLEPSGILEADCYELLEENEAIELYTLKEEYADTTKPGSHCFVLIKHELPLPADGDQGNESTLEFFSLTMHLLPDGVYAFPDDYCNVSTFTLNHRTPFYRDWLFRVAKEIDTTGIRAMVYKQERGVDIELLPGCDYEVADQQCFYRSYNRNELEDNVTILAMIDPVKNVRERISVRRIYLGRATSPMTLKTGDADAVLYRPQTLDYDDLEENRMGFIPAGTHMGGITVVEDAREESSWQYQQNIIKIRLPHGRGVESREITGFVHGDCLQHGDSGYEITTDCYAATAVEARGTAIPDDLYKIISFKAYLEVMQNGVTRYNPDLYSRQIVRPFTVFEETGPIFSNRDRQPNYAKAGDSELMVIVNERYRRRMYDPESFARPPFSDGDRYLFTTDEEYLPVAFVDADDFSRFRTEGLEFRQLDRALSALKLYTMSYTEIFEKGDTVVIEEAAGNGPSAQLSGIHGHNLFFVKFQVPEDEDSEWYVRAEELALERGEHGKVALHPYYEGDTVRLSHPGIVLYDSGEIFDSGRPKGNPRQVLAVGKTMKLMNADGFLSNPNSYTMVPVQLENGLVRYVLSQAFRGIEVKSAVKEGFELSDDIQIPDDPVEVGVNDLLGYGGELEGDRDFYHLSLFFKEWPEAGGKRWDRYLLPLGIAYRQPQSLPEQFLYLPRGSTLTLHAPQGDQRGTVPCLQAREVQISRMIVYFKTSELTPVTDPETLGGLGTAEYVRNHRFYRVAERISEAYLSFTRIDFAGGRNEPGAEGMRVHVFRNGALVQGKIFAEHAPGSTGYMGLVIDRQELEEDAFRFWIEETGPFSQAISKPDDQTMVTNSAISVAWYEENPELYTMAERPLQGIERTGEAVIRPEQSISLVDRHNAEYTGFPLGDGVYYLPRQTADGYKKDLLAWDEFFTIKEGESDEDIFCDIANEVLAPLDMDRDGVVRGSELRRIFNHQDEGNNGDIVRALRRLGCQFPFEWNRELYGDDYQSQLDEHELDNDDDLVEHTRAVMDAMDIWAGIKDLPGIDNAAQLWHVHPVYFLQHLRKMGLWEMNPYAGHTISCSPRIEVNIRDNPGFAPRVRERSPYTWEQPGGEEYYAGISTLFNDPYTPTWTHDGVDFVASRETPVI